MDANVTVTTRRRPAVQVIRKGAPAVTAVGVPGPQGATGGVGPQGAQGAPGDYGSIRYGEMMGAVITDVEANTDVPFIVTAPRDVISDLRGPFTSFEFLDAEGTLRARKSGDSYALSLRFTAVPQMFGGWITIGVYIAGNISGIGGATSERTVSLTKAAGQPHRVDEPFQLFPRSGFIANGARIYLRSSVPVRISQEVLFITPLQAAP